MLGILVPVSAILLFALCWYYATVSKDNGDSDLFVDLIAGILAWLFFWCGEKAYRFMRGVTIVLLLCWVSFATEAIFVRAAILCHKAPDIICWIPEDWGKWRGDDY